MPFIQVSTAAELEATIHQLIPLSVAMGVTVASFEDDLLTLEAPLAPNINHQMSAFGGSLSALSALAGWGMVQLQIGKMHIVGNTVVGRSEAVFLRPVLKHLVCRLNSTWRGYRRRCNHLIDCPKPLVGLESGSKEMI
jgi:thioesterase domain-containing protein